MIAAATGSLLGGRLVVIGGRDARSGKGCAAADLARFGAGAAAVVRPDYIRGALTFGRDGRGAR
jgi:hypothetical protein